MASGQLAYNRTFSGGFSGQLMDSSFGRRTEGWLNATGSDQPAGIGVTQTSPLTGESGSFGLLAAATDPLVGITVLSFARDPGSGATALSGTNAIFAGRVADLLVEGAILVKTEQPLQKGDPVYVRFASGTGTVIGAFRKDNDSGTARLVKGARVLVDSATGANGNVAGIYFSDAVDRDPPTFEVPFSHGVTTVLSAPILKKLMKARSDQYLVIDAVDYDNPTGYTGDASNYWTVGLEKGAGPTTMASVTTAADLAADTFVALTLNATAANRILPPSGVLTFALRITGTPATSLPAGSGIIHAHYV